MIALLTIILVLSIGSSCWSVYSFLDIKKKEQVIEETSKTVVELYKDIADIRKELSELKENPAEFTRRFSLVDFRLKKMEDTLSTFNNGFGYKESWMR